MSTEDQEQVIEALKVTAEAVLLLVANAAAEIANEAKTPELQMAFAEFSAKLLLLSAKPIGEPPS